MLYVMLLTICYNRDRMRQAVPVIVGATHSQLEVVKDDRAAVVFNYRSPPNYPTAAFLHSF